MLKPSSPKQKYFGKSSGLKKSTGKLKQKAMSGMRK